MKRLFLRFICFFAVFGIVLPAYAFELGLREYYWFPEVSGVIRVDGAGIVGTELDLEDDLGIDDERYPAVEEDDVKFDFDNSGLYVALTVSF